MVEEFEILKHLANYHEMDSEDRKTFDLALFKTMELGQKDLIQRLKNGEHLSDIEEGRVVLHKIKEVDMSNEFEELKNVVRYDDMIFEKRLDFDIALARLITRVRDKPSLIHGLEEQLNAYERGVLNSHIEYKSKGMEETPQLHPDVKAGLVKYESLVNYIAAIERIANTYRTNEESTLFRQLMRLVERSYELGIQAHPLLKDKALEKVEELYEKINQCKKDLKSITTRVRLCADRFRTEVTLQEIASIKDELYAISKDLKEVLSKNKL